MSKHLNISAVFCVLVAMLLGAPVAHAQFGGIRDNAAFFSDAAKSEAMRNISEMERRFKKDLVIETFKEVPDDVKNGVNLEDKAALGRMFDGWARKQFRQLKVNGLYVLISKQPAHLQIEVGNDTQQKAFTLRDRDALVSTMLNRLQKKQYDDALLDGVNFVSTTMASHAVSRNQSYTGAPVRTGSQGRVQTTSAWGWVIPVLIAVVGIWLVVRIIRAMSGGGMSSGSPGMPMGTGGGGFMSSLLGGMFGAAAGMWLYDKFSGGSNAWGSESNYTRNDDSGFSGQDTDSSGSGGDFGGDSGGDSGGGDFGGGDTGGGGGDF